MASTAHGSWIHNPADCGVEMFSHEGVQVSATVACNPEVAWGLFVGVGRHALLENALPRLPKGNAAWADLNRLSASRCHFHTFALAPTLAELRGWRDEVTAILREFPR